MPLQKAAVGNKGHVNPNKYDLATSNNKNKYKQHVVLK